MKQLEYYRELYEEIVFIREQDMGKRISDMRIKPHTFFAIEAEINEKTTRLKRALGFKDLRHTPLENYRKKSAKIRITGRGSRVGEALPPASSNFRKGR